MALGGDMTGKAMVLIAYDDGLTWRAILSQHEFNLGGEDEVAEMERKIKSPGYYPSRTIHAKVASPAAKLTVFISRLGLSPSSARWQPST